jgi:FG-GAP repeat
MPTHDSTTIRLRLAAALFATMALGSCSSSDYPASEPSAKSPDVNRDVSSVLVTQSQQPREAPEHLPYRVDRTQDNWASNNPAQNFVTSFGRNDVLVRPLDPSIAWALPLADVQLDCSDESFETSAHRRDELQRAASLGNVSGRPEASGRPPFDLTKEVVVYDHRDRAAHTLFRSWYADGSRGLEQGFSIPRPPNCVRSNGDRGDELVLRINVGPSHAAVSDSSGRRVLLRRPSGAYLASYSEPWAVDDAGRSLHVELDAEASAILVRVDLRGARYPILIDPLVSTLDQTLVPDPILQGNAFGSAVAIRDDVAVLGHEGAKHPTSSTIYWTGAAYVFRRVGGQWTHEATLRPDDADVSVSFGAGVSLGDSALFVSAPGDPDNGYDAGAVYQFAYEGGVWVKKAKIFPKAPSAGAGFGHDLVVHGSTLLVGTAPRPGHGPCKAYAFERSGSTWTQNSALAFSSSNTSEDVCSVALDESTALVGAPELQVGTNYRAGMAFVFKKVGGYWQKQGAFVADDGGPNDAFGSRVAVAGGLAIVAAPKEGGLNRGTVYAYRESGSNWTLEQKLGGGNSASYSEFGSSLAFDGDLLLIGAVTPTVEVVWPNANWSFESQLVGSAGFGQAISLYGGQALIGIQGRVYRLERGLSDPCSSPDQCQSGFCADGVCCDDACGGAASDCRVCSKAAGAAQDGICGVANAGVPCRASGGTCDPEETCDGVSTVCPQDDMSPAGHVCRPAAGGCDVPETCSGTGGDCPPDAIRPQGYVCQPMRDVCDVEDTCDGTSKQCDDEVIAAGTSCRPAAGPCDAPEACNGTDGYCPPDASKPLGEVCRESVGECDRPEACDGVATDCPADELQPAGMVCRFTTHACDAQEVCSGSEPTCPQDGIVADGQACPGGTCLGGLCYYPSLPENESANGCSVGGADRSRGHGWVAACLALLLAYRRR